MKKLILASLLLASGLASAREYSDYARVISSAPVYEEINTPRRECWTEYRDAPRQARNSDSNIGGAIVGGVVGGLLGNQVGSGNGKKVATVGGAVAGGAIGRKVQGNSQEHKGDRVVERRCERIYR